MFNLDGILLIMLVFIQCLLVFFAVSLVEAQRNDKEEAICAPFLTSQSTSPLIAHLPRNLTIDEIAEFSCELVLQDRFLPQQIRLTIHEGLFHLASRHTQMGLHKAHSAYRHANILAEIMPKHADFRLKAGTWSIHAEVSKYDTGAMHFHEILHGLASAGEQVTNQMKYTAYRGYIKALSALGQWDKAFDELVAMLEVFPYDFEAVSMLTDNLPSISLDKHPKVLSAIAKAKSLYELISSQINYPRSVEAEEITRLSSLPTAEEFTHYIQQRKPVLISFANVQNMSNSLQWRVDSWLEVNYMVEKVQEQAGEGLDGEYLVLAEEVPNNHTAMFGHGLFVKHESKNIADLLRSHAQNSDSLSNNVYINVQLPNTGTPPFHPPLQYFKDDIALDHDFFSTLKDNITSINLWMGLIKQHSVVTNIEGNINMNKDIVAKTASKAHRDALDNLYFLLEGTKQFKLWHPRLSLILPTLSPTFAVHNEGLSFQLNVKKLRTVLYTINPTLLQELQDDQEGEAHRVLVDFLSAPDVMYEMENLHFTSPSQACGQGQSVPAPTMVVDLQPGDVLYLPTGWFHEVTSFPSPAGARHLALNIWWRALHWKEAMQYEQRELVALTGKIVEKAIVRPYL